MTFRGESKKLKKLPESQFPRNHKDHTIIMVTTTKMDILVKLLIILKQSALFSRRPEAQKSKPAATTSGLPKLNLTMVSNTSNQCDEFQGRRPKNYMKAWETKTEDP